MKPCKNIAVLITALFFSLSIQAATSVTHYGITWNFSTDRPVGQYASGDWWVLGPVTITSVSPSPTGTRNGSAVNPIAGRQGYDSRGAVYSTADNVTFPYSLQPGQSLVSSRSKGEDVVPHNVGVLHAHAILTAVSSTPPAGSLRPGYAGTYKAQFNTANFNWSLLPNLSPTGLEPSAQTILNAVDRPHIDHHNNWGIQYSCAEDNWANGIGYPCYGRDYARAISRAAMYVMLNTPHQEELTISLIQIGIDNYSVVKAGGYWDSDGGHFSGRKWPIVFAALMLNDPDMLDVGLDYPAPHFAEDGHTYYGAGGVVRWGRAGCSPQEMQYFLNGCTGSGKKDCRDPDGLVDACEYRICCNSDAYPGQMLSTLMLGGKDVWNHNPFFDYTDRWVDGEGGSTYDAFIATLWNLYRDDLPPIGGGAVVTYQAEDFSAASGCIAATNWTGYTGSGFVDFGGNGTWTEWNNIYSATGGTTTLTFRYANAPSSDRQCALLVNGTNTGNVSFSTTGNWQNWTEVTANVILNPGNNTIRLTANTSSGGPNLDKIDVEVTGPQIYQAEDFSAASGCIVATNWTGYTGSGFVDFGGNGTWTEWNNIYSATGGTTSLTFRYANATSNNRQCALVINGNNSGNVAFNTTGNWQNWTDASTNVTLNPGNNTIRLTANTSAGGPNLDQITVD